MNVNYYGTAENKAATGYAEALIVVSVGRNYSSSEALQLQGYILGLGVITGFTNVQLVTPAYRWGSAVVSSVRVGKLLEKPGTVCIFIYRRAAASPAVAAVLNRYGRNRIRTIRQMVRKLRHYA